MFFYCGQLAIHEALTRKKIYKWHDKFIVKFTKTPKLLAVPANNKVNANGPAPKFTTLGDSIKALWNGNISLLQAWNCFKSYTFMDDSGSLSGDAKSGEVKQFVHDAISFIERLPKAEQRSNLDQADSGGKTPLHLVAQAIYSYPGLCEEFHRLLIIADNCLGQEEKGKLLELRFNCSCGSENEHINLFELCSLTMANAKTLNQLKSMAASAAFADGKSSDIFLKESYKTIAGSGMKSTAKPRDRARNGAIYWAKNIRAADNGIISLKGKRGAADACSLISGLWAMDIDEAVDLLVGCFGKAGVAAALNQEIGDNAAPNPRDESAEVNLLLHAKLCFGGNSPEYKKTAELFQKLGEKTEDETFAKTIEIVAAAPNVGFDLALSIGGKSLKAIEKALRDGGWKIPDGMKFATEEDRAGAARLCSIHRCDAAIVNCDGSVELRRDRIVQVAPANGRGANRAEVTFSQLPQLRNLIAISFENLAPLNAAEELRLLLEDSYLKITIGPTKLPRSAATANGELGNGQLVDIDGNVIAVRGTDIAKLAKDFPGRISWKGFTVDGMTEKRKRGEVDKVFYDGHDPKSS